MVQAMKKETSDAVTARDVVIVEVGWPVSSPRWNACARADPSPLVDFDTPERLGGLALWPLAAWHWWSTPLQARMKIPDT